MERALQKERSPIFATAMHRILIIHEWAVSQQRTSAAQGTDTICCVFYIGLGMDRSYIYKSISAKLLKSILLEYKVAKCRSRGFKNHFH